MKKLLLLGIVTGTLAAALPTQAHGIFSLHIGVPFVSVNIGSPPPLRRVRCAPLVVAPPICARPAIVIAPPRVNLCPPLLVIPPPVVIHRSHPHRVVTVPPPCR